LIAENPEAHAFGLQESFAVLTMLTSEPHRLCFDCWDTTKQLTNDYMKLHDYLPDTSDAGAVGGGSAGGGAAGGSSRN